MDSENDIYEMCRLCLAKEQVDVHIFEEESEEKQTFLKISTCLPIKISFDDRLPKKICTDCLCKLDAMYQFWNKSISSESQLLTWLDLSSIENVSQPDNRLNSINLHSHIYVKEEPIDCLKTEHDIKLEVMEESYDDESYNQPIKEFPDQESSSHCKRKRDPSPECEINSDDDPLAQDTETKKMDERNKFTDEWVRKRELANERMRKYRKRKDSTSKQLHSLDQNEPVTDEMKNIRKPQVEEEKAQKRKELSRERSRRYRERKRINALKTADHLIHDS